MSVCSLWLFDNHSSHDRPVVWWEVLGGGGQPAHCSCLYKEFGPGRLWGRLGVSQSYNLRQSCIAFVPPQSSHAEGSAPGPQDVNLFGKRVVADVIN